MLIQSFALTLLSATSAVAAFTYPTQQKKGLSLDVEIVRGDSIEGQYFHQSPQAVKRSNSPYLLQLENEIIYYQVKLLIGSNNDEVKLMLDTGSSDTWVMGKNLVCESRFGSQEDEYTISAPDGHGADNALDASPKFYLLNDVKSNACKAFGYFSMTKSKTFRKYVNEPEFRLQYMDGTYASGFWGIDSVNFGGKKARVRFGVVNETSCAMGIFGIGPILAEATYKRPHHAQTYANFPVQLKKSGVIDKIVYSLSLKTPSPSKGILDFGTVDHKKYTGQLQTVPLVNLHLQYERLDWPSIKLDGLYFEHGDQKEILLDEPIGAVLDSGSTIQFLPRNVLGALAYSMSAEYFPDKGIFEVDCAYKQNSGSLVYDFSGIKIRIPLSTLINKAKGKCHLEAKIFSDTTRYQTAVLGINFLRHAYVVYNFEDMEISMAQAAFSVEHEVEIITESIPRAVKAPRYAETGLSVSVIQHGTSKIKP